MMLTGSQHAQQRGQGALATPPAVQLGSPSLSSASPLSEKSYMTSSSSTLAAFCGTTGTLGVVHHWRWHQQQPWREHCQLRARSKQQHSASIMLSTTQPCTCHHIIGPSRKLEACRTMASLDSHNTAIKTHKPRTDACDMALLPQSHRPGSYNHAHTLLRLTIASNLTIYQRHTRSNRGAINCGGFLLLTRAARAMMVQQWRMSEETCIFSIPPTLSQTRL